MLATEQQFLMIRPGALCAFAILAIGCGGEAPPRGQDPAMATTREETEMTMLVHTMGEGAPVVLVGGGLTGWLSWIPHQERLATTRRVARAQPLVVQLGLENRPVPTGYSVEMESAALAAAVDVLHPTGTVDLVAWSYGGFLTLDYALTHPERVRTLTLIEPPAFWVLAAAGDEQLGGLASAEGSDHGALARPAGAAGNPAGLNPLQCVCRWPEALPFDAGARGRALAGADACPHCRHSCGGCGLADALTRRVGPRRS